MADQQGLTRLIAALREMRAQAVQVRDGAYRKKDLKAVKAELARKLAAASKIHSDMTWSSIGSVMFDSRTVEDVLADDPAATRASANLSAALGQIPMRDYSVESIDAAIGSAVAMQQ
jgi:hypothetical protein